MNENAKYTNGPWSLNCIGTIDGEPAEFEVCDKHKGVICVVNTIGNGDAALIASAPDLLAALERAMEELRLIRMKDCNAVYDVTLKFDARAAIKRARGE